MFDNKIVKDAFFGTIGVGQTGNDLPIIDSDLLPTDSSLLLSDLHPFFTHENIYYSANGLDQYTQKEQAIRGYSALIQYYEGDILKDNSIVYRVKENVINTTPPDAKYAATNLYSNYLRRKVSNAYLEAIRSVIDTKIGYNSQGRSIISNMLLYDGRGNTDVVDKRGRFVGYKINLLRPNMKIKLGKVALQLTESQELNLYVFNTNNPDPVLVHEVSYTTPYKMTEFELPEISWGGELESNEYIIGYYEDDLVGYAVKRQVNLINPTVGCCNNLSFNYHQKYSKFVAFRTFYVDSEYLSGNELSWDNGDEITITDNNFGLNLGFDVKCDVTDLILKHKKMFYPVIQQQLIVSLLKDMVLSTRSNTFADNIRGLVLANGSIQTYIKIEEDRLKSRIKSVGFDISGLDSTCLPNTDSRFKIRTGSI